MVKAPFPAISATFMSLILCPNASLSYFSFLGHIRLLPARIKEATEARFYFENISSFPIFKLYLFPKHNLVSNFSIEYHEILSKVMNSGEVGLLGFFNPP